MPLLFLSISLFLSPGLSGFIHSTRHPFSTLASVIVCRMLVDGFSSFLQWTSLRTIQTIYDLDTCCSWLIKYDLTAIHVHQHTHRVSVISCVSVSFEYFTWVYSHICKIVLFFSHNCIWYSLAAYQLLDVVLGRSAALGRNMEIDWKSHQITWIKNVRAMWERLVNAISMDDLT